MRIKLAVQEQTIIIPEAAHDTSTVAQPTQICNMMIRVPRWERQRAGSVVGYQSAFNVMRFSAAK
jgi:hypothetical protein